MTRDQAHGLLDQHRDALNRHDVPTLASLYAEDAVLESPMFKTVRGREAIRASFEQLFTLFPDYAITMQEPLFICEANRAAEFSVVTGTQHGPIFGLPPTGRPIVYHAARLFVFDRGRIAHEQRIYDFAGVLERLEKTRIDRELATASAIQQLLMAGTDAAGEFFEVARASLPCRTISGDFLEYHHVPNVAFGLAIGDVSGKGPPAALVAAMLHGMLSMAADGFTEPGALVQQLNRGLRRRGIEERYATLCYARLAYDGRFSYSNAGHPSPLLVRADDVEPLTAGGPILGVFEQASFPSETLQLHHGDTIVFYSDGVTEASSPDGEEFGVDRLIRAIQASQPASPSLLVSELLSTVRRFTATSALVDDATIAVISVRGV
jgi:steroid delta-isomerase-like uncharacterized protein